MSKETKSLKPEPKTLPFTKAETAENRLEEILANKTIIKYTMIFEGETYWHYYPVRGEVRLYPDGVELIYKGDGDETGMLHSERRRIIVNYDLEKEYELQKSKTKE